MTKQTASPAPVALGIIGLGGFAGAHHAAALALEKEGVCRLRCTCDPQPDAFREKREEWRFAERGVQVFDHHERMLDACRNELDVVTIPTPIPLHAPMHRACIGRGLAVYLEKPPTLDWRELEEMIALDMTAPKRTNVGFNFIIEPQRQAVKQRLVAGEFGAVRSVGVSALWPRPESYYRRASWAGRLEMNGRPVLDSPMGNAMAHITHNALFWSGAAAGLWSWGEVTEVAADLYRHHCIQGTDTLFVKAAIRNGPDFRLCMTHACAGRQANEERIVCERATISAVMTYGKDGVRHDYEIRWSDGRVETIAGIPFDAPPDNLRAYCRYLRGLAPRPMTLLEDCRPFVHLNNLAYIAAGRITTIPDACADAVPAPAGNGDLFHAVRDLPAAFDRFMDSGAFPAEQGLAWAAAGTPRTAGTNALPTLNDVVRDLAVAAATETR